MIPMHEDERRERYLQAREDDRKRLKDIASKSESLRHRVLGSIDDRLNGLQSKILELREEKNELLSRAPLTKQELSDLARQELRKWKETVVRTSLTDHLQKCQETGRTPFSQAEFENRIFRPDRAWKIFFMTIDEADLDKALEGIKDEGAVSRGAKEARVGAIDREIDRLTAEVFAEVEKYAQ